MKKLLAILVVSITMYSCKSIQYTKPSENMLNYMLANNDFVIEIDTYDYVKVIKPNSNKSFDSRYISLQPNTKYLVEHRFDVALKDVIVIHGNFRIVAKRISNDYISLSEISIVNENKQLL